jgi:hypothetical protein
MAHIEIQLTSLSVSYRIQDRYQSLTPTTSKTGNVNHAPQTITRKRNKNNTARKYKANCLSRQTCTQTLTDNMNYTHCIHVTEFAGALTHENQSFAVSAKLIELLVPYHNPVVVDIKDNIT